MSNHRIAMPAAALALLLSWASGHASAAAANPQPAPSDAAPLPDLPLPKGFSELGTTPSGRSIFSNFTHIANINDLIQHVGDALGGMFDAKPQFGSAGVDAKNKNGGIATFTAMLKGSPIKGVVLFGVNPQGVSSATVIYARPNTPGDEFTTLMQTVPAQPKLHTVQAADGSGSVDIPEGWTLLSQSMTTGSIGVAGPKGPGQQLMDVGEMILMDTPNDFRVQTAKGNHDSAVNLYRMTRGRGVAPQPLESYLSNMNISACVGPEEAFKDIIPKAVDDRLRQAGRPWNEYGDILFKTSVPPAIAATDDAEFLVTSVKIHNGDKTTSMRLMMKVETTKTDATNMWRIYIDRYYAPEATADRDFPLMVQIYNSIQIQQAAIQRQLAKEDKAFQSISAYFQAKHEALLERGRQFQVNQKEPFDRFEQQQAAQAQARHDSCSDMIESCLGVRDVLDTATGNMHKVDLYNSNNITDTLNGLANDPNRFVQIPLRYER